MNAIEVEADIDHDDDAHFLSLVEAAEAEALSSTKSKRQKLSSPNPTDQIVEGSYMAALRGSRSSLWQQQQLQTPHKKVNTNTNTLSANSNGGCFKCGVAGHWARDCTSTTREGEIGRGRGSEFKNGEEGDVKEKQCPCGLGCCLVLTSNTAKNPGRKFYRCPAREENGGCGFFEWCDHPSSGLPSSGSTSNYQPDPSFPDFQCPCGAGSCLVLVTKSGKNVGQQYYRCPANEGRGCGFFKWCNDPNPIPRQPALSLQNPGTYNHSSSQFSCERNGSSCFKCGQEGHWAKDCAKPSSDSYSEVDGTRLASSGAGSGSGSCFKCGKAGHWVRDCTAQGSGASSAGGKPLHSLRAPSVNKY